MDSETLLGRVVGIIFIVFVIDIYPGTHILVEEVGVGQAEIVELAGA